MEFPALHLPVVRYLFKQKLFQIVLKKLWNNLSNFTIHHLTAFTYVLKMTPHQVLKQNIDKVILLFYLKRKVSISCMSVSFTLTKPNIIEIEEENLSTYNIIIKIIFF